MRECIVCKIREGDIRVSVYKRDKNSEYYGKMLCSRHYAQLTRYGEIRKTSKDMNDYVFCDDYIEIILRNRQMDEVGRAIIDRDDYDKVKNHKWRLDYRNGYAITNINGSPIALHKIITNTTSEVVDHKDRNRLNNRSSNLRVVNRTINSINKGIQSNNTSGIIGVCFDKRKNKWLSRITVNKKSIHLGHFSSLEDAKIARLKAEYEYFGADIAPQRHLFKEYKIGDE